MAAVTLQGIEKRYDAHQALSGIDLEVADGEFVALLGPSGLWEVDTSEDHCRAGCTKRGGAHCISDHAPCTTSAPPSATSRWCSSPTRLSYDFLLPNGRERIAGSGWPPAPGGEGRIVNALTV